MLMSVNVKRNH